jgi:hypothetical protein
MGSVAFHIFTHKKGLDLCLASTCIPIVHISILNRRNEKGLEKIATMISLKSLSGSGKDMSKMFNNPIAHNNIKITP